MATQAADAGISKAPHPVESTSAPAKPAPANNAPKQAKPKKEKASASEGKEPLEVGGRSLFERGSAERCLGMGR
jgi:threonyl-tRNA synthetase